MDWAWIQDQLSARMRTPLPGVEAQYEMAHLGRYPPGMTPPAIARDAGVLMLLYPHQGETWTVFIRRSGNDLRDRHKGQISFPGGKREPIDPDMAASALRETEEEIGVIRSDIQLVRPLTPLYIPVSNFLVHPFLGMTTHRPSFVPQLEEVADILEMPLSHFFRPDAVRHAEMAIGGGLVLRDVPFFDVQGHMLWGATAMILNEFRIWLSHRDTSPKSVSL
jgi:8-oxo-dGTP pyrophosphatase MutT (NUDIX family)